LHSRLRLVPFLDVGFVLAVTQAGDVDHRIVLTPAVLVAGECTGRAAGFSIVVTMMIVEGAVRLCVSKIKRHKMLTPLRWNMQSCRALLLQSAEVDMYLFTTASTFGCNSCFTNECLGEFAAGGAAGPSRLGEFAT
jgi:hypothetical protein